MRRVILSYGGGMDSTAMVAMDSWAEGARLFAKSIKGRKLSVSEWEKRFDSQIAVEVA